MPRWVSPLRKALLLTAAASALLAAVALPGAGADPVRSSPNPSPAPESGEKKPEGTSPAKELPGPKPEGQPEKPAPAGPPDPEATAAPQEAAGVVWYYGFQSTFIGQQLFRFRSPYQGQQSFRSANRFADTESYTLYLGVRPDPHLAFYIDPEWGVGRGLNRSVGLAGYTNGDVLASGSVPESPYLARYFARWIIHAGEGFTEVEPSTNNVGGYLPAHRVVVTAGKLCTTDIFDLNSYASNPRTQFLNWTLDTHAAYDYAADSRGYTHGLAVEWVHPDWTLRAGSFQMPRVAGGANLSWDLAQSHGDQVEGEFHPAVLGPKAMPMTVRLLAFHNQADMGDYRRALRRGRHAGGTPDVGATRRPGTEKYGFGLNLERPLADEGKTGLFARASWSEGSKEDFAFTEADRAISFGAQVAGDRWHRAKDRVGLGLATNWLSGVHAEYLAAGGRGFQLGDGALRYGPERIAEAYYSYQISREFSATLDYQWVANPGYNRDRGPASVVGLRLHAKY